jgi:hypothetical protein
VVELALVVVVVVPLDELPQAASRRLASTSASTLRRTGLVLLLMG